MKSETPSRLELISLFSFYLNKGYEEPARESLDRYFETYILVEKAILNKNIDPTTELQQMK